MNPVLAALSILGLGVGSYEGSGYIRDVQERRTVFAEARDYADNIGKPLLVIGSPKWQFNHPCGDVTIDTSPWAASFCNGEVADVHDIPYPDKHFGAAYCSHVLEHMPSVDSCWEAIAEMDRVADKMFIVVPRKDRVLAWLHPDHHLWVTLDGDSFIIEQR